ncbi:hypothetical protein CHELA40_15106 [Chelatococcus asaccharovorans]|nr:hypothetical protein CHELA17_60514 [Chelatococcus asaccharovorans]CAH1681520.1 hypothetical protein CHELA40_15106 [Chelatococcus asaccharovorans]
MAGIAARRLADSRDMAGLNRFYGVQREWIFY